MYGRDEHRDALSRIARTAAKVESLRDEVNWLRADLFDDEVPSFHLGEVSRLLGGVLAALDNQATELPTPVAR